jgi:hypothetical protein
MEGTAGPAGEVRAGQLNGAIGTAIGKLTADFIGAEDGALAQVQRLEPA